MRQRVQKYLLIRKSLGEAVLQRRESGHLRKPDVEHSFEGADAVSSSVGSRLACNEKLKKFECGFKSRRRVRVRMRNDKGIGALLTDAQLWIPVAVLAFGIVLLTLFH